MPSKHEQALLDAIIQNPDDDAPRLIYADYLETQGKPERAEFIRVQCHLAGLDEDDPRRRELRRREYELLAEHGGEWAGPLVGRVRRWRFRRGFVEQVKVEAGQFRKEARWLLEMAPVQELEVPFPEVEDVRALLACKHIRRITRLNLDHAKLGDAGAALLAGSPNLAGLRHLSLRFTDVGPAGLLALAESPHLKSLRSLDVTANDLPENALGGVVAACRLPLEGLDWDSEVGPDGIRCLAASPLAGRLKALHLREVNLGTEGLRLLAESPAFTRLEELTVEGDEIGAAGLRALGESPLLGRLVSLGLTCVAMDDEEDEGAAALARAGRAPKLRQLDLGFNGIGPAGARALADSPLCDGLTRLVLSGNPIGDQGVKAVAKSPHLGKLRRLDLYQCKVTPQGAKALLASPHLDRLTCLRLDKNAIGRKAFDALHACLGERLYHEHFDDGLDAPEIIRRVKAEPPRCLRGLGARTDTELIRRFPPKGYDPVEYASVTFELTPPDPGQKAVLLGYGDDRGYDIFFSPYAIRWEPSGRQREFFDAEQHGGSGETDGNCTIVGSGKRTAWKCGKRGCRDHVFLVTFIYRIEYPPTRRADSYLPFADEFYHFGLDAYCAGQDRVIEIATFECK